MGKTVSFAAALVLASLASGCIAGLARIGAEEPRNYRATFVDRCSGSWCTVHEGTVGSRMGLVLGVAPGAGFGTAPTHDSRIRFGMSSIVQFMMLTRVPRLALGGALGFDTYSTGFLSLGPSASREHGQMSAAFGDVRAALGLSHRLSIHAGVGPGYGLYRLMNGDTTQARIPWHWGGHLAVGMDYMFQSRRERSAWGIRLESNTTMLPAGDILGSSYRPLGTMIGAQLIWLSGT